MKHHINSLINGEKNRGLCNIYGILCCMKHTLCNIYVYYFLQRGKQTNQLYFTHHHNETFSRLARCDYPLSSKTKCAFACPLQRELEINTRHIGNLRKLENTRISTEYG